jgi:hypothetical protein
MEPILVDKTLRELSAAGYLKTRTDGLVTAWYWTYNNRSDTA